MPHRRPRLTTAQRHLLFVLSKIPEVTPRTYQPAIILETLGLIEWIPNDHDTAVITEAGQQWLERYYAEEQKQNDRDDRSGGNNS